MPHFIRGVFDGDGSIWDKGCGYAASFTGGKSFLERVRVLLATQQIQCNPIRHRYGKDNNNSCQLDISGADNLNKLASYMYCGGFFLQRKRSKFDSARKHSDAWRAECWSYNGTDKKIVGMYNEGMTPRNIALQLNLKYDSVRGGIARLRKNGSLPPSIYRSNRKLWAERRTHPPTW